MKVISTFLNGTAHFQTSIIVAQDEYNHYGHSRSFKVTDIKKLKTKIYRNSISTHSQFGVHTDVAYFSVRVSLPPPFRRGCVSFLASLTPSLSLGI